MKLLIAMFPTIVLVVYSQLITKWRVEHLIENMAEQFPDGISRLLVYLQDPYILSAYVASFFGSIAWMFVAERFDVSHAFPIYIGITVMLVMTGGILFFKEAIDLSRTVAVLLILLGVYIGSRA